MTTTKKDVTRTGVDLRALVLEILLPVTAREEYSHRAIRSVLDKYAWMDAKDRAFIKRLSEGVLERMLTLDYCIAQFSKVKPEKMKPVILNILRMGTYQILYMDGVPDSAACNEAVKLAVKKGFGGLKGFVNGVLRNIARNREKIVFPQKKDGVAKYLSVSYSMPRWLTEEWLLRYGEGTAERMLETLLKERPLTIRTNLANCTLGQLKEALAAENVALTPCPGLSYAFYAQGMEAVGKSAAFLKGMFAVQDLSSMLAAEAAAPAPGNFVLDVCAAPGGKSAHLAEKTGPSGRVEARDLSEYRVRIMEESFGRLGLHNIRAVRADALIWDETMAGKADVVLADLPCSGLGVMGRKKDIRYRVTPQGIEELAALQRDILRVVSGYVKPGGVLLYSTCTVSAKENEENADWIAESLPFRTESLAPYLPEEFLGGLQERGYAQFLPGREPCDGFFLARFRREE